jgi:peptide/nickel transport system permease protein
MSLLLRDPSAVSAGPAPTRIAALTLPARWARRCIGGTTGAAVGLGLLTLILGACLLIPIVLSLNGDQIVATPYQAPSASHPFGTDTIGRDLFARVLIGGRLDFLLAFVAVVVSSAIGAVIGVIAGASPSGWVDMALMRVVDAVIAFPFLVLVLVLVVIIGPTRTLGPLPAGAPAVLGGIILGNWAFYARLARGQTLALRERDYIVAARTLGLSRQRIVLLHLLPGTIGVIAAYAVGDVILSMITIASLSFVGVGVQPPAPEWGAIMFDGRAVLQSAWWIAVSPGLFLAFTGLGLSLVADAILQRRGARA